MSGVGQDVGKAGRATNSGETWSNAGRQLHRNSIGVWAERISGNGTIGAAAPALFPGARRRPH
ncbi:hypothetical protein HMPREF0239_00957 [Clostridium sp. ATCC BAA-442]|nr:hypothetical protein HMPREF0239_00957 [Clostridium sp. ATCC BAA-442]